MFDKFGYGPGGGGGPSEQGRSTAQPSGVSQRPGDDAIVDGAPEARVFVLGGNGSTLVVTSSFRPEKHGGKGSEILTARLIPLARTPLGVVAGTGRQDVGIPLRGVLDWLDRTFTPDDERAFVAAARDVEMLARTAWEAPFPEPLDDRSVLNVEDLPDEIAEALAHPASEVVSCAICRSLCVRDDFVWKEKQLCAWDFHAQVFGKRGPWRQAPYEERHFDSAPQCAYVAPPLLRELGVEEVLALNAVAPPLAHALVNSLIDGEPERSHMAVRTEAGISVLREA